MTQNPNLVIRSGKSWKEGRHSNRELTENERTQCKKTSGILLRIREIQVLAISSVLGDLVETFFDSCQVNSPER